MQTHIETVVTRYRGKVPYWDVLNEALADDENFIRPSTYLSVIGDDFIAKAFEYAHAADPEAMNFPLDRYLLNSSYLFLKIREHFCTLSQARKYSEE